MCQAFEERRLKIVRLPLCYLIGLFNLWRNPDKGIARPLIDKLPEDAEVVSVEFQHNPRSLEVTVCSMQFEPVPEGQLMEIIPGILTEYAYDSMPSH